MKFCPDCGTVTAKKVACAKCGKGLHATMKFCPFCGGQPKEVFATSQGSGILGSRIEAAAHLPDERSVIVPISAAKPVAHSAPFTPPAADKPAVPPPAVRTAASASAASPPLPSSAAGSPRPAPPSPAPGPAQDGRSPEPPAPATLPAATDRPTTSPAALTPEHPLDPKSLAIEAITGETGISFLRAKRLVDMGYDLRKVRDATLGDLTRIPGFDEWSARQVLEGVRAHGHPLPDSVDRYEKTLAEVNDLKARFAKVSADVSAVETLMRQAMQLRSDGKVEWAVQVIMEARSHLVLKINAYVAYTREKIQARAAQPDLPVDTREKLKRLYFYLDTALSFRDHTRAVGLCAVAQTLTGGA
jgi:hypothetical protein